MSDKLRDKISYRFPSGQQRFELEIKRSRFITTIACTDGKEAARKFIDSIRTEFPDASHNCWAFVAGSPDDVYQVDKSDDGEPRGTAGKPMLNVLQHSGLGRITVVVTRYFGGIKLGAGGLVRAYSQCVSHAVQHLETEKYVPVEVVELDLPYDLLDQMEHYLASAGVLISRREYTDKIRLELEIPQHLEDQVVSAISELGQGRVRFEKMDEPGEP